MSNDRDYISIEGCFCLLAFAVIAIFLIVYLSVYTIIALFAGSCAVTFIAGIVVLLSEINALPDVVPAGQDKFYPVSSFELFKKKNDSLLHSCVCGVALNTAMIMCCGKKRMRNEDIFVLNQKKAARQPWLTGCLGFIFLKVPLGGFYLIRTIFFGTRRDIMNDNGESGPLDNDFVRGNPLCVALTYTVLFLLASLRYVTNILFLFVYCVFHFLFCWSRKLKHNNHIFYHPAFRCQRCGRIHLDVGPSITGAGVIFQECACGEKFCAAIPHASKKLIAVCPVCFEELRESNIQQ